MKDLNSKYIKVPVGFWHALSQLGIEIQDIVHKSQLPITIINQTEVTATQYFAIWQAYSDLIGDIATAALQLSTVFETTKYPPTVMATYHAQDYRSALYQMAQYKQFCPPESLIISENSTQFFIELEWSSAISTGPPILIASTFVCLIEIGRRGTGQHLVAQSIEFTDDIENVAALEAYFGCPVQTHSAVNRLILRQIDVDLVFTSYNKELLDVLIPVLNQSLQEEERYDSITEQVKWIIKHNFQNGYYPIQKVANVLNMSDRTLQRHLTKENTNFKQILLQSRQEKAKEYLADPSVDLKEIAFLIGYKDQNSFYRAFRLWEGDTPSNWRIHYLARVASDLAQNASYCLTQIK